MNDLTLKATKVERCPAGSYHGVLAAVHDLGMQPGFPSKTGKKVKPVHKFVLIFETARKKADGISLDFHTAR
jgi:hypothetical protein